MIEQAMASSTGRIVKPTSDWLVYLLSHNYLALDFLSEYGICRRLPGQWSLHRSFIFMTFLTLRLPKYRSFIHFRPNLHF